MQKRLKKFHQNGNKKSIELEDEYCESSSDDNYSCDMNIFGSYGVSSFNKKGIAGSLISIWQKIQGTEFKFNISTFSCDKSKLCKMSETEADLYFESRITNSKETLRNNLGYIPLDTKSIPAHCK